MNPKKNYHTLPVAPFKQQSVSVENKNLNSRIKMQFVFAQELFVFTFIAGDQIRT